MLLTIVLPYVALTPMLPGVGAGAEIAVVPAFRPAASDRPKGLHDINSGFVVGVSAGTAIAETRQIDTEQSRLTVFVYKSGLFSAFADDHVIDGSIASGTISDAAPRSVAIEVRAGDLKVRDPNLSASKRAEVQTRMLGAEVLDAQTFPSIEFESTAIEAGGPDRWTVAGRLSIHGLSRPVTFPVSGANGRYRGAVTIKQRDFGIVPISIAGGTVKVKDEIKIEFEVVAR
jgi:polyisoprenoid-binding protein YceI